MDTHKHDQTFVVTFLAVIGGLLLFTFAIIGIANLLDRTDEPGADAIARTQERIKPVGQVITDPAALLKLSAAQPAARAPMAAADVLAKVCAACHQSGVLEAPKFGDKSAWAQRKAAAGGAAGLVKSAINGKNQMPPRGGDPQLTDAEMKAAVELLLKQSGA